MPFVLLAPVPAWLPWCFPSAVPFVRLAPLAAFLPCLVPFVLLAPLFWSRSSSFPLSSRGEKKSEFGSRVGITGADRTALSVDILLTSMPW